MRPKKERKRSWMNWRQLRSNGVHTLLVSGIGLALFFAVYQQVSNWQRARVEATISWHAQVYQQYMQRELQQVFEVVNSIGYLFNASRKVTRYEFRDFVDTPLDRYTEIRALAWIPRVSQEERESYEHLARKDGMTGFQFTERQKHSRLKPASKRDRHFPVYYLEPLQGNEAALGLDLASHRKLRSLLQQAGTTGEMVATTQVFPLPEEEGKREILLLSPVYKQAKEVKETGNREERSLHGFALGLLRVGAIKEPTLRISPTREDLWLGGKGRT